MRRVIGWSGFGFADEHQWFNLMQQLQWRESSKGENLGRLKTSGVAEFRGADLPGARCSLKMTSD